MEWQEIIHTWVIGLAILLITVIIFGVIIASIIYPYVGLSILIFIVLPLILGLHWNNT